MSQSDFLLRDFYSPFHWTHKLSLYIKHMIERWNGYFLFTHNKCNVTNDVHWGSR